MGWLLTPFVYLMDALRYRTKFALVGVLVLVLTIGLAGFAWQQVSRQLAQAEHARLGVGLYVAAMPVLTGMQQHRGMTSGLLGGADALLPKVAAKGEQVSGDMTVLAARLATVEAPRMQARWRDIEARWQALVTLDATWASLAPDARVARQKDNFAQHTALISEVLHLIRDIADATELGRSHSGNTLNLVLPMLSEIPEMTERLGKLRGKGTGIIALGKLSESDRRIMLSLLAELSMAHASLQDRLVRASLSAPAQQSALARAGDEIRVAVEDYRQLATDNILDERYALAPPTFFDRGTAVIDVLMGHVGSTFVPTLTALVESAIERLHRQHWMLAGGASAAILLVMLLFAAMSRSVTRGVNALSASARRVAGGDYGAKVDITSRDELGEVAEQFNAMTAAQGQLIGEIGQSARQLEHEAGALNTVAASLRSEADAQSLLAGSTGQNVAALNDAIAHINHATAMASERADRAGTLALSGHDVVLQTVDGMRRIAGIVTESAGRIEQLGAQSSRISTVVATIREIAEQTNLLALNAAIEAARAGESGRGFAVVADEVRKLAERTGSATQEIVETVTRIQSDTGDAVRFMQDGVGEVQAGVALAEKAGDSMGEIRTGADEVNQAVSEISAALQAQLTSTGQLNDSVGRITTAAQSGLDNVHQAQDMSQRLATLAKTLLGQLEVMQRGVGQRH